MVINIIKLTLEQQHQMRQLIIFLLFSLVLSAPYELIKFTLSSYIMPNKNLEMELDVVAPRTPNSYPAILYLTGLAGLTPSYFQQALIDSIAEKGFVFMTISKIQSINPQHMTSVVEKIISWLNDNLKNIMTNRAPGVFADIQDRFIVMSHSAGGHVMTEYLNSTCGNVKMQIMLDPVDGTDPFGIKKDFITTPGVMLPYATPVLIIGTELDQAHMGISPPCAPNNMSNMRFYNAMSGPKWFLNVSKYGHVDFYNAEYRDLSKVMCQTCRKNCDFAEYKNLVKDAILNFIDGVLNGNPSAIDIIQNARFTIPTEHRHDYMQFSGQKGGFCVRVKKYQQLSLSRQ